MNVISIPVQIRNRTIVLTSIKHEEIHQVANLEVTPDTEIVVHLNLANWHPFEVSANSIHFALVDRDSTVFDE
jgi:hypothetical protein